MQQKFFVVGYQEVGLGLEVLNPRQELRVFQGYSENNVLHYLDRERIFSMSGDKMDIMEQDIFPRQVALKRENPRERHIARSEPQIYEVDSNLASQEIEKLKLKRVEVSNGLVEFIELQALR